MRALLYNFEEDNGARWAVYDEGIEMPSAEEWLADSSVTTEIRTFQKPHGTV